MVSDVPPLVVKVMAPAALFVEVNTIDPAEVSLKPPLNVAVPVTVSAPPTETSDVVVNVPVTLEFPPIVAPPAVTVRPVPAVTVVVAVKLLTVTFPPPKDAGFVHVAIPPEFLITMYELPPTWSIQSVPGAKPVSVVVGALFAVN